jgi:hypothetical protein
MMSAVIQPLFADDGEFIQADEKVDLLAYTEYVANFRPRPQVSNWVEWDLERIISTVLVVMMVIAIAAGVICFSIFMLAFFDFDPLNLVYSFHRCTLGT